MCTQAQREIFDQLEKRTKETNERNDKLTGAFKDVVNANGSGETVRKKIRKKLKKKAFISAVETLKGAV